MRILVAEDDERLARTLSAVLVAADYVVEVEADGAQAWRRGDTEAFDAVVLDLGLPSMDGLVVLKRWRENGRTTPVLILTARGNWDERVEGIEAGADDYLAKPFRAEEVLARLRAIIQRATRTVTSRISLGRLMIDTRAMQVSKGGVPMSLAPQEYKLVAFLAHRRGKVVSQMEITDHLYAQDFERGSNSVEVLVGRVRRKLGDDVIKTRRGSGYILDGEGA